MTEYEPNDPAMIAGADQAEAATHHLLDVNGLEIVAGWPLAGKDFDGLAGEQVLELLAMSAIRAAEADAILVIAAARIDDTRHSQIAMVVRRWREDRP